MIKVGINGFGPVSYTHLRCISTSSGVICNTSQISCKVKVRLICLTVKT